MEGFEDINNENRRPAKDKYDYYNNEHLDHLCHFVCRSVYIDGRALAVRVHWEASVTIVHNRPELMADMGIGIAHNHRWYY